MELVVHAIIRFAVASAPQRPPTAGGLVTLARYILQGASVRYAGFDVITLYHTALMYIITTRLALAGPITALSYTGCLPARHVG